MRSETYIYCIDDGDVNKKRKITKLCVIKWKFNLEDHKICLEENNKDYIKKVDQYQNYNKNIEARNTMYSLKKLIRLHWMLMMIKEYNQLTF